MNMRMKSDAGRDDAGSDVGTAIDVDAAIGAKNSCLSGPVEVQVGEALGGEGVAEDRVKQPHVQDTDGPGLPPGMSEVLERAGESEGVAVGSEPQGAQI